MFDRNDEQYLLRILSQNSALLFLGAGFSRGAINRLGKSMPLSVELSEMIWRWLGYEGDYDGTQLSELYDAMLGSGRKDAAIRDFLESHLLCDSVPSTYDTIAKVFWYRIYTTNVDNLVDQVYRRVGDPRLLALSYPNSDPQDRDQTLSSIQLVKLNGQLPGLPRELSFSVRQFARRAMVVDPLYEQFTRDYATHPTIFVGTELNEPLLMATYRGPEQQTGRHIRATTQILSYRPSHITTKAREIAGIQRHSH